MDAAAVKTLINQTLTEAIQDGGQLAKPIEDIAKAHAASVVKAETGVGGELDTGRDSSFPHRPEPKSWGR